MMNPFEKILYENLEKIDGFNYDDINRMHLLPIELSTKALGTLLDFGCDAQNTAMIFLVRKKVDEINKDWLKIHIIEIAKEYVNFNDEWDFRRFVELIIVVLPELKDEAIKIVEKSTDPNILEAAEDYKEMESL